MPHSEKKYDSSGPLLSASTILILSGFLIGLTVGRVVGSDLSPYVLACGLSGCLAFIALDVTASRRAQNIIEKEKESAEKRLEAHLLSLSSLNITLPPNTLGPETSEFRSEPAHQLESDTAEFCCDQTEVHRPVPVQKPEPATV